MTGTRFDTPAAQQPPDQGHTTAGAQLVEEAIALVGQWLDQAHELESRRDRSRADQLAGVIDDESNGVEFAMRFVDRVVRPEDPKVAADQLQHLVSEMAGSDEGLPSFLSPIDRVLLRAGGALAPVIPQVVIPLAVRRMRSLVGPLVVDADPAKMTAHLAARREEGFRLNVNQLGEAVLGEAEAQRRWDKADALLDDPAVHYVSVKTSSIVSQLNYWAWDESVERVMDRLRPLFVKAAGKGTFINLDMEEYHDLGLTIEVFTRLLDEPELRSVDAGIVLQAYLPDSFPALQQLVNWANTREPATDGTANNSEPGTIKIRLVKGANLAMEKVEAAMHGWPQAPYHSKAEVDANYKRCLDWVLTPERTKSIKIGLASHNLFDVAWGYLLAGHRGVADRLELEMLQGMAMPQARAARETADDLLLYTPVVAASEFDVAISYLFRRLEENASDANFIRHLFGDLRRRVPGEHGSTLDKQAEATFDSEAGKFRAAVESMHAAAVGPNRTQDRSEVREERALGDHTAPSVAAFTNEPDTDPAMPANRAWATDVIAGSFEPATSSLIDDTAPVDAAVATARTGAIEWAERSGIERRAVLHAVADELSARRGDLINAMVHEANKTFAQADPEVSEAIDFARYYGDRILELSDRECAAFEPLGVVGVIPPWNFPVAIPAGGVLAALAAGNGVVFKPAPQTPRCAEIVAECCWDAGVPQDVLQFVRVPDNDVGRHLVTSVDAVILTGAYETAELFRSWKPDLPIFAETSGKNSLIVTPNADLDLAVADLVDSAFGHSGQKCSAASLGILVGDVYTSERFRRQLVDAVTSLTVGPSHDIGTDVAPTIEEPSGKLLRALTSLDNGEEWLVEPRIIEAADGARIWSPGVRLGVKPGSWFHQTECFGPVLGLMVAANLDEAIAIQNGVEFGLTGGIHTLDPQEIDTWTERVEVGNAYINRGITGAIVARQPFGGWKRSTIGPGAKAGGPNYVAQLGRWVSTAEATSPDDLLVEAKASDDYWWQNEFSRSHDPVGLFCESNIFRYRPLSRIAVRVEPGAADWQVERVLSAAGQCGVFADISRADSETTAEFASRLPGLGVSRVRVVMGDEATLPDELIIAANAAGVHLAAGPVTTNGRIELLHYLREQAVSRTLHRYGNLL